MIRPRTVDVVVTMGFLAAIFSAGLIQTAVELSRGRRPQALDLLCRKPTAANLRQYEKTLEDSSWVWGNLRPVMQYLQFVLLRDAGDKGLSGQDGWMFYRPGVEVLVKGDRGAKEYGPGHDPVAAIAAFRDDLAARGMRLLVVVAPNKESVYPERLTARTVGLEGIRSQRTSDLLRRLEEMGVESVDLFALFAQAKRQSGASGEPLYLVQDTHWSGAGVKVAAKAIASRILDRGWIDGGSIVYDTQILSVRRIGDVLRMLQSPWIERTVLPEEVSCMQILQPGNGRPYQDDPDSTVLILGDSFLRIYETDEPGSAGLIAHLAKELKQPLTSLVSDGGASTLVRQELYRRPTLLKNKKVVIWEFVERDIEFGAEGWQIIPLPPLNAASNQS